MHTNTDHSGKVIDGRYHLIRLINRGGMGKIYLAQHAVIGRKLVVKVLHTEFKDNTDMIKRFYREAQSAALVKHRNIVDIFDVGVTEWGEPYLAMEYLEGESLACLLRKPERPLSPATVSAVVSPMLSALQAMHEKGIIHRDIKPDNVVISEQKGAPPEIKIIDFGISKIRAPDMSHITREGAFLGTLDYMAPEQLRGDPDIHPNVDLWAVGVVCYQMATGLMPYVESSFNALYAKILNEPPTPPEVTNPDILPALSHIISRALDRDSTKRYQSAEVMLRDLERIAAPKAQRQALDDLLLAAKAVSEDKAQTDDMDGTLSGTADSQTRRGDAGPVDVPVAIETPSSWLAPTPTRNRIASRSMRLVGLSISAFALITAAFIVLDPFAPPLVKEAPGSVATHTETRRAHNARSRLQERSKEAMARSKTPENSDRPLETQRPTDEPLIDAPTPETEAAPELPETVRITVGGIPEDGRLFIDGKRVHENPFTIPYSLKSVILTAEASTGQQRIRFIPNDDRSLELSFDAPAPDKEADENGPSLEAPSASPRGTEKKERRKRSVSGIGSGRPPLPDFD